MGKLFDALSLYEISFNAGYLPLHFLIILMNAIEEYSGPSRSPVTFSSQNRYEYDYLLMKHKTLLLGMFEIFDDSDRFQTQCIICRTIITFTFI